MCGICGVVQLTGEPVEVIAGEVLDRMTDVISHRGPDDVGTYAAPGIAIGVRRLSIVDVAEGHQPFPNEDGSVWAAQNGELYEHVAIRDRLRSDGHRFTSRCDTEIIPHLYEAYGDDFPTRLRGMFGLVVWDEARRRAVLARDRLGIKPLYYATAGDRLVFGSELKSVLASGIVDVALDYAAIDAYLTLGFFPAPLTPLLGVRKLLPGHTLVIENGTVEERAFWSYPAPTPISGLSVGEHAERLLEKLDESVRLRLMSDVPLGAMLSGGLDSSLIVALMARHMTEPVKTFAVGFAGAGETNELADARYVSDRPRHRSPRARAVTRRPGRPRGPVLAHGRATRRPLGTWLPCVVGAGVPPCHRGSLRAGRRRAVRRLPQAPRRSDQRRLRTCDSRSRAARRPSHTRPRQHCGRDPRCPRPRREAARRRARTSRARSGGGSSPARSPR